MAAADAEQPPPAPGRPAEPEPEPERRPPLARRITGGVRARILASYVILLAIAAFASVIAVRQVLLVRLDDRVEEDLQQEVAGVPRARRRPGSTRRPGSHSATTSKRSSGPTSTATCPTTTRS